MKRLGPILVIFLAACYQQVPPQHAYLSPETQLQQAAVEALFTRAAGECGFSMREVASGLDIRVVLTPDNTVRQVGLRGPQAWRYSCAARRMQGQTLVVDKTTSEVRLSF